MLIAIGIILILLVMLLIRDVRRYGSVICKNQVAQAQQFGMILTQLRRLNDDGTS